MSTFIICDVNETLLDLKPVRDWFRIRFNDQPDASMWFSELLRLSFVSSVTDRYTPFTDLAASALETVVQRTGESPDPQDTETIKGLFVHLPAHRDVEEGLVRLSEAGFTLAALTNSPRSTASTQLTNAGISDMFDAIMSVEMVNRFKPHRSVYLAAAEALGTSPSDMVMVAAHDWDISGAMACGLDGVFIERPGQQYSRSMITPTLTAPDVGQAAKAIIKRYGE